MGADPPIPTACAAAWKKYRREVAVTGWRAQADRTAAFFHRELGAALHGVYVHGSAALSGWTPASDLDVLVTATEQDRDWARLGFELLLELSPTPCVELSVVCVNAAVRPAPPWPFLLHVNQVEHRVALDSGQGDADLPLHYLVASGAGITVSGPAVGEVFGAVPRSAVLAALRAELSWALAEADQRYAVLNACRALAYGREGLVLSKQGGGVWALARGLDPSLIEPALAAQAGGADLGRSTLKARAFVAACQAAVEESDLR